MPVVEPTKGFGKSQKAGGEARKRKVEKPRPPQNSADKTVRPRSSIPDHVSRRMVRRILLLSGLPTLLAMGVFVLSYLLISQDIMRIEPIVTIGVSGVFFVLGLLGLSYGVLSASWEDEPGSPLGWEQFGKNIQRLRASMGATKRDG